MDAVSRVVGAVLLLTGILVGIYFVVEQLEFLPLLWPPLNYLMALSAILGVIFAYLRKRALESAGLDRIVTRRYLEANILFFGFLAIAMLFFWNWFDLIIDSEPQGIHRSIVWAIVNTMGPLLWGALGMYLLRGGTDD